VPPGSERAELADGLVRWTGFGVAPTAGVATPLLEAVHALAAVTLVLLVPGLGWSALAGGGAAARLAWALAISTGGLALALLALRGLSLPPSPLALALLLGAAGAAPLPWLRGRGRIGLPWIAVAPAALALPVFVVFATLVVPPLEDQDMETQGTAHALATRQAPSSVTNRGTTTFFAHPPLLHAWQAGSFALSGRLERIAYHHEAARALAASEPGAHDGTDERSLDLRWQALLRRFLAEPNLWPGRRVNVVISALAVGLLAWLAAGLAGSAWAGAGLAAAFVSFPEAMVRGSYGGYFAAATLLSLLVLASVQARSREGDLACAGALAFLADQKGLLAPVAWVVAAPGGGSSSRRLAPLVGATLAFAAFAAYGLSIDSAAFVRDFLKEHVVERLLPSPALAEGAAYPGVAALWLEFAARYGPLFLAAAAIAAAQARTDPRPLPRCAAAMVWIGALAFSLTDWRQTKHLAQLVAPALLAIAAAWPARPRGRRLALAAVALAIAWNLHGVWRLLTDFAGMRPQSGW
jgi:hypothetical protein